MPGSHGEITLDDQNRVDNDHKSTRRRRRKKKQEGEEKEKEKENQLLMPSSIAAKPRKRFIDKFRKRPKSPKRPSSSSSGWRKGGCFSLRRTRRREEDGSPSSPVSDPNDECFTHEMLRVMLETNDFCSDECNPHR